MFLIVRQQADARSGEDVDKRSDGLGAGAGDGGVGLDLGLGADDLGHFLFEIDLLAVRGLLARNRRCTRVEALQAADMPDVAVPMMLMVDLFLPVARGYAQAAKER